MNKIKALIEALYYGQKLTDSASWKSSTIRMGFFLAFAHAVVLFLPLEYQEQINVNGFANVLDFFFGLFVAYSTAATTETLGIGGK